MRTPSTIITGLSSTSITPLSFEMLIESYGVLILTAIIGNVFYVSIKNWDEDAIVLHNITDVQVRFDIIDENITDWFEMTRWKTDTYFFSINGPVIIGSSFLKFKLNFITDGNSSYETDWSSSVFDCRMNEDDFINTIRLAMQIDPRAGFICLGVLLITSILFFIICIVCSSSGREYIKRRINGY